MFRNAYDPIEGRTLELRSGDFFREGLHIDLLVISAWDSFYEPQKGSMIAALEANCGLVVKELARAYDFTGAESVRAWVSEELDTPARPVAWPKGSSRFRRLVVVESPLGAAATEEISVFQRMFRLLALLPLHHVPCRTVATPLLNAGRQGAELNQLIDSLQSCIRIGFENVPELTQLVIFDLKHDAIQTLNEAINQHLGRPEIQSHAISSAAGLPYDSKALIAELAKLAKRPEIKVNNNACFIIGDIRNELEGEEISLVTVGISARKLVEVLVKERTKGEGLSEASLFKQINYLEPVISAWLANALHGVRIFGNWMGHAEVDGHEGLPSRQVNRYDLAIMLLQLHAVISHYPWSRSRRRHTPPVIKKQQPKLLSHS